MYRKDSRIIGEWLENSNKALLVTGARQIGKTWLIRNEIEKSNYTKFEVNFIDQPDMVSYLNAEMSAEEFLVKLKMIMPEDCKEHETVVFFDEIQKCPEIVTKIKFLVDDGSYKYVMSGSLLGVELKGIASAPVGYLTVLRMYPMDFEEFAWAMGEEMLIQYIRKCFDKKEPLIDALHKKAMFLLKQYVLVGGMPKAIDSFIANQKQFEPCEQEKRDILETYRDDIHKIDRSYQSKVLSIFDQIPAFLSQHEKRVRIQSLTNDEAGLEYEETFFWLADSMICNECFQCSDPNVGLSLNEKRNFIKCYMGDTGLLITHTFDESSENEFHYHKEMMNDKLSVNQGMFFENVVAQMLVANGHKLYFYTHYSAEKHRNDIEIDFLLTTGSKVSQKLIPIEVKSSKSYKTTSLDSFYKIYKNRIDSACVIHPKNLSIREDGTLCLPVYMTFCL